MDFQKKCFEEKTFAEIAGEMQIAESTVKSRFYQMEKEFGRRCRRDETKVTKYAGRISTGRGNSDAATTDHRKSGAPPHGKMGTASQYLLGTGTESHFLSQSGNLGDCGVSQTPKNKIIWRKYNGRTIQKID